MTTNPHLIIQQLDAIEATAYCDMFAAAPVALTAALQLRTCEMRGATLLVAPGLPTPMFNRVIGLGNTHSASAVDLDEITNIYRAAGVNAWWLHVSPGAQPDSLAAELISRGFRPPARQFWVKMLHRNTLPSCIETAFDIRIIRASERQVFGEILCDAFEMPAPLAAWFAALAERENWHAVGAFDHNKLLGGGLLRIEGATAWLGAGGVRPDARGHHVHRAIMALRIQLAIEAGCSVITTETGEPMQDEPNPSLRNMLANGFEKVFSRANYASPVA